MQPVAVRAPEQCAIKVGEPYRMAECGKPIEFLTAEQAASEGLSPYSGWRHVDRDATGHYGFPKSAL